MVNGLIFYNFGSCLMAFPKKSHIGKMAFAHIWNSCFFFLWKIFAKIRQLWRKQEDEGLDFQNPLQNFVKLFGA